MTSGSRRRVDRLLVEQGLADSREKAQALILAGVVYRDDVRVEKAGQAVPEKTCLVVHGQEHPYVSRGGLKLEGALKEFRIKLDGLDVLDVGASTGGFTDCLLQHGVSLVCAVDVGYGQLDWKLRNDPRVILFERTNIRHLDFETVGRLFDLAVIDASFISLRLIIPKVLEFLKTGGRILALVKPQFEAGAEEVGRRGLVKNREVHRKVLGHLREFSQTLSLRVLGETESSIRGKKSGNREFFMFFEKTLQTPAYSFPADTISIETQND